MGYSPAKWECLFHSFGSWETFTNDNGMQMQTTVRVKLKPREQKLSIEEALEVVKQVFSENIKPLQIITPSKHQELDMNKLLLLTGIEAHLGKLSNNIDTNTSYDHKIVRERFNKVIEDTMLMQDQYKCGTALMLIGGDFIKSSSSSFY